MSGGSVAIPDDRAFASFKAECLCEEGWNVTYNKSGTTVWIQSLDEEKSLHKIKVSSTKHVERCVWTLFIAQKQSGVEGQH